MFRLGFGVDSHRLTSGDGLRIGGIFIPAPFATVAHSDGDALIHAIVDALFGAVALGDIGDHFPDSAPENRDRNSAEFLAAALQSTQSRGYQIGNLDATIFLERPKLSTHKKQIAENIARLLDLPTDAVNIKAKTGELLGDVGNSRAIIVHAAVLLHRA